MADSIACSLAGRASGQSVGASSAGQIIEDHSLCVCVCVCEKSLHIIQLWFSISAIWKAENLQMLVTGLSVWCLGVQLRWDVDRKRIGLLRLHKVTNLRAGGPRHMFSYPLPFADPYPLTPNIPSPLAKPNSRLEWQQRLLGLITQSLLAWSPFQRAQNTSALFGQTLFWVIKSVCECTHFHLIPVWYLVFLLHPPRCLLPSSLFVIGGRVTIVCRQSKDQIWWVYVHAAIQF